MAKKKRTFEIMETSNSSLQLFCRTIFSYLKIGPFFLRSNNPAKYSKPVHEFHLFPKFQVTISEA